MSDLGNNFFVTQDKIGHSRAEVVKDNMLEMNDSVKGHHVERVRDFFYTYDILFFG